MHKERARTFHGTTREVWTYVYDGRIIWGATGTIIHRMMAVLDGRLIQRADQDASARSAGRNLSPTIYPFSRA